MYSPTLPQQRNDFTKTKILHNTPERIAGIGDLRLPPRPTAKS